MLSYKNQCQRLQSRISAMELEKTGATRRRGVPTSNSRPKEPAAQDHDINSKYVRLIYNCKKITYTFYCNSYIMNHSVF